ncbi:MAG: preprotein translocase subunit YajC [Bacteroidota bacterium]
MTSILLQAGGTFDYSQIVFFLLIGVVIYFFMIRPQQKKQKDQKKYLEELKKGDRVVTIGGLHGKVFAVEENEIVMEVDKGMKLRFEKSSVSLDLSKKANDTK